MASCIATSPEMSNSAASTVNHIPMTTYIPKLSKSPKRMPSYSPVRPVSPHFIRTQSHLQTPEPSPVIAYSAFESEEELEWKEFKDRVLSISPSWPNTRENGSTYLQTEKIAQGAASEDATPGTTLTNVYVSFPQYAELQKTRSGLSSKIKKNFCSALSCLGSRVQAINQFYGARVQKWDAECRNPRAAEGSTAAVAMDLRDGFMGGALGPENMGTPWSRLETVFEEVDEDADEESRGCECNCGMRRRGGVVAAEEECAGFDGVTGEPCLRHKICAGEAMLCMGL